MSFFEQRRVNVSGYKPMSPGMASLISASKTRTCQLGNRPGNILASDSGGPISNNCNIGAQPGNNCQSRSTSRPIHSIAHGHSAM